MYVLVIGSVAVNLLLVVLGVFLVGVGFRWYRVGNVIRDTPTARPGSVAAGRAEVEGVAQPRREPIVAPFTGEECVYLEWTLEEHVDGKWVERESDSQIVPFYLEGETGRVLVRPDKHPDPEELPWEYDSRRFAESEREEVETFLRNHRRQTAREGVRENPAVTENPATTENPAVTEQSELPESDPVRWRYVKRLLPPGTPLYVFGSIEPGYDVGELGIEPDKESGLFVINRGSEDVMMEGAYWLGLLTFSAGLLFVLWGGVFVLTELPDLLAVVRV